MSIPVEPLAIRAVIFDLGKVLIPFDFQRGYDRLQNIVDIPMTTLRQRIQDSGLVARFESGQLQPQDFVTHLGAAIGTTLNYPQFCEIWSSIFLPDTLVPEELLVALQQNYRLVLLSNTNAIHFEMLEKTYPILRHFEHRVLSYEVGAMKPAPAIYRRAVELAGCRPEECFFTDDVMEYVQGARDFGMQAAQFLNVEQLRHELKLRNIRF